VNQDGIVVRDPTVDDGLEDIVEDLVWIMRDGFDMDSLDRLRVPRLTASIICEVICERSLQARHGWYQDESLEMKASVAERV
jgi:hypothetical protein